MAAEEGRMPYQHVLDGLVRQSEEILGEKCTGIYLHGSMAMGCFHPDKSDIDLIIVVNGDISDKQKMRLMKQIVAFNRLAPPKGLEISVVKREHCRPFTYPTPFELHFSPMHLPWFSSDPQDYIARMKGKDIDLAAHFTVLRNYGVCLCGEEIDDVFAAVPRQNYIDSVCADIKEAKEDILTQPISTTLNLCRALALVREGLCLSKKEGGMWGMEHLPAEYHSIISEALECYALNRTMTVEKERAIRFAEEVKKACEKSEGK